MDFHETWQIYASKFPRHLTQSVVSLFLTQLL